MVVISENPRQYAPSSPSTLVSTSSPTRDAGAGFNVDVDVTKNKMADHDSLHNVNSSNVQVQTTKKQNVLKQYSKVFGGGGGKKAKEGDGTSPRSPGSSTKGKDKRRSLVEPVVQQSSNDLFAFPTRPSSPRPSSPVPERLNPQRSIRHSLPSVSITTSSDLTLTSPPSTPSSSIHSPSGGSAALRNSLRSHLNRKTSSSHSSPFTSPLQRAGELKRHQSGSSISFLPDPVHDPAFQSVSGRPRKLSTQSRSSSTSNSSQGSWVPPVKKTDATISQVSAVGQGSPSLFSAWEGLQGQIGDEGVGTPILERDANVEDLMTESPPILMEETDDMVPPSVDMSIDYDGSSTTKIHSSKGFQSPIPLPSSTSSTSITSMSFPSVQTTPPKTILKDNSVSDRPARHPKRSVSFSLPTAIVIQPTVVTDVEVENEEEDQGIALPSGNGVNQKGNMNTDGDDVKTPTIGKGFDEDLNTPKKSTFGIYSDSDFERESESIEVARHESEERKKKVPVLSVPNAGLSVPLPLPYLSLPFLHSVASFIPLLSRYIGLAVVDERNPCKVMVRPLEPGEEEEFGNAWRYWREWKRKGLVRIVLFEVPLVVITTAFMWLRWKKR